MTIEKGDRSLSPVHVHVDETTPVHVHVKKPRKQDKGHTSWAVEDRVIAETKTAPSFGASNLRRSTATARARSKSPCRSKSPGPADHWIPPPAKTSKGVKYTWQGPKHRLEIHNPAAGEKTTHTDRGHQTSLHLSDLSTDEEDLEHSKARNYEKKIDSLLSEVGTLKSEVELQKVRSVMGQKEQELQASRRALHEQEEELQNLQEELHATERENKHMRRSMEQLKFSELGEVGTGEMLMKKLVEVEMEGQAVAQQVSALKDLMRRIKEDKKPSSSDSAMIAKQRELLMERFSDFEEANRSLRRMLRERHQEEGSSLRLNEQRDLLMKKLGESEDVAQRLKNDLLDRDRKIKDLRLQLSAQQEENLAISGLQSSLESTRGHLQKQLRQKEGDCNRMAVQIRTLETQLAQEKIEVDHLSELLQAAKHKSDQDKEALKKATRVQKQRASRSEDAVEQLKAQVMDRDNYIAELRAQSANDRLHFEKLVKEKAQALAEAASLQTRITELESIMHRVEDQSKMQVQEITAQLHHKSSENSSVKLENERLKTTIATLEEKVNQTEAEVSKIRSSLKQYETLVDEYRSQLNTQFRQVATRSNHVMNRSRREADETLIQLEEQKRESTKVIRDGETELEKVKARLQARLNELEPIPELLKTTEFRLQDANEKLLAYEKRNTENTKLIAELTSKVEYQAEQMDTMRDRFHRSTDESRGLQGRVEALERKQTDLDAQNRDLLQNIAKKEEALHQANLRLEERTRENQSLTRQLEAALTDARRLTESSREKQSTKERATQSRILDLESQLSQARTEIARLKREKEEGERKFNSRLYDLKDRLEQAHCTNRSMQNYVQFLKSSYANVFGDSSALPPSPVRGAASYPY